MATFNNGESGLSIRTKLNNVMQHADGTTSALVFNESGADVDIRIESAGQPHAFFIEGATAHVGIGTGSPPARLSVITNNANNVSTILDGDLQLYNSSEATRAYTFLSKSRGSSMVGGNIRLNEDVTTGTHIGYSSGTDQRGGAGIVFTNHTLGASNYGETIFVRSNDTNDDTWEVLESARIDSSGKFIVTGNAQINQGLVVDTSTLVVDATNNRVGIGTAAPATTLDVNGSLYVSSVIRNTSGGSAATPSIQPGNDTNTGMFWPGSDTIGFSTAGTEIMRITPTGNVGISTTNPLAKLTINTPALDSNANAQVNVITLTTPTPGNVNNLEITSTRNITGGADWTTAGHRIQQKVDATWMGFLQFNGGGNSVINSGGISFGTGISTTNPNAILERMRITSSGRVGIGTSSPTQLLHVTGSVAELAAARFQNDTGDSALFMASDAAGTNTIFFGDIDAYNQGFIQYANVTDALITRSNGALVYQSGGSAERMRITSVGDMGINNSTPVMPLDVNGDTLCRGIEYNIQPTQTSIAAAATLTIAQLLTKIIQYTGAVANLTLPTGTLIEGGIHASSPNNTSFDFSVINTGSGAATLLTATGLTLVGSMVVTNGTSGLFRVRKTATNTFTVYRLA